MSDTSTAQFPFSGDFPATFANFLSEDTYQEIYQVHGPRGGGLPKISSWQWLMGKVFHIMAGPGSFSDHVKQITRISISNGALSQRGASLGWELVASALKAVLRPLADPDKHPDAFYNGLRLVAVDGIRFNLRNTPAINAKALKTRCSKGDGEPAFAHLCSVALVELGTHQPLAAAFSWRNLGELTLARLALAPGTIPLHSLLLGDRLFGTPLLIHELLPELESSGGGLLFRVKANMKARLVRVLSDGSRLVDVEVRDPKTRKLIRVLRLREIYAEVHKDTREGPALRFRLWTNLLDSAAYPAQELAELYAKRWEHELFYRELKSHLHGCNGLLDAQTPESAAQEALAMMMGASLIARQRAAVAAEAGVPMTRVSFAKVLDATVAVCKLLEIGRDLLDEDTRTEIVRRVLEGLAKTALIPKRKPRSCTRGLRQPVKNWPKIKNPTSNSYEKSIVLTNP